MQLNDHFFDLMGISFSAVFLPLFGTGLFAIVDLIWGAITQAAMGIFVVVDKDGASYGLLS